MNWEAECARWENVAREATRVLQEHTRLLIAAEQENKILKQQLSHYESLRLVDQSVEQIVHEKETRLDSKYQEYREQAEWVHRQHMAKLVQELEFCGEKIRRQRQRLRKFEESRIVRFVERWLMGWKL